MLIAGLVALLSLSAPFEDIHKRFHFEVPAGWQFAPQPNSKGAAFRKSVSGSMAQVFVTSMSFDLPLTLDAFGQAIGAASRQEPGYELLKEELDQLAGLPSLHRVFIVYINGNPKMPKMVDERIAVDRNTGYVIHCETRAEIFSAAQKDFVAFAANFEPGPLPEGKAQPSSSQTLAGVRSSVVGRWEGSGQILHLSPSGVVLMGNSTGTYKLEPGLLTLDIDGKQVMLQYQLNGDQLRVSGDVFGAGLDLTRVKQ